ncbi:MAG: alanine--tRNA ligase [Alphaproteobacteria bacterium]|nr:alanine--tRNA ligase [Alphaproteobacteria bacterium]
MLTNDVRAHFLDYFRRAGHEIVPSSPLVPRNDPTLLFTNAGMVQFKNVFTGLEKRPYVTAASSQKCVRAGGKHNDLENVGYTARHHTFFEMLGNFSFGDYFKDRAIELAWKLLTEEFALPIDRLLITVYAEDEQAAKLWKKIAGLPDGKIVRIASADNFWAMGETGPCGPCSEIFWDHGDKIPGGPPGSPDAEGDRFVEIWNLVFMQYEQLAPDRRVNLPHPSIDTGMGLERIAAVLQGKHDNYDTDILRALVVASAEESRTPPDGPHAVSHRVIADHLRASAFLIADGVLPSKEGRGYVLRRIMRRAMRHAHMLGTSEPLLWKLMPALVRQMGQPFPGLVRAEALVTETLRLEETNFRETLARGLKLLDEEESRLAKGAAFPGEVAFKLYDTFGFPLDLTEDVLRGRGRKVETKAFDAAMARQREEARKSWVGSGEAATDQLWFALREELGATEFLGYEATEAEGKILAIVRSGERVDAVKAGDEAAVVVSQTPFYGESGGQVGDTGAMFTAKGAEFAVSDTQKRAGELFVHLGKMTRGGFKVGDLVELRIDEARRDKLRANHSVTHLLHQALRRRLGEHVTQKGSLVAPDRLRFDFSQPRALSDEDRAAVEAEVNARIRQNAEVRTRLMTPDRAVKEGALALFGEKYGDEVRVVSMGEDSGADHGPRAFSVELCGGTHVRRTGDIGLFKIVAESAVASGVRRIEALTGAAAEAHVADEETLLRQAADAIKAAPAELPARLAALLDERKRLERELSDARRAAALGGGTRQGAEGAAKDIAGVKFAARALDNVPAKELKSLADDLKKELGSGVVALVAREEGKASIVVGVTADLTQRFDAVELVRLGAAALGGKGGGGRPDMAQAGGPDPSQAEAALAAVERALAEKAKAA